MGRVGFSLPVHGRPAGPADAAPERASVRHADADAGGVREAMLQMAGKLRGSRATVLTEAIDGCRTLEELCELRRPLLQAVSTERGELQGLRQMMRIDAMLLRAWPEAPVSRPAALG